MAMEMRAHTTGSGRKVKLSNADTACSQLTPALNQISVPTARQQFSVAGPIRTMNGLVKNYGKSVRPWSHFRLVNALDRDGAGLLNYATNSLRELEIVATQLKAR